MKLMKNRGKERIEQLGRQLFGKQDVNNTIPALEGFFHSLGSPVRGHDAGIDESSREEILGLMNRNKAQGLYHKLTDEDRREILTHIF